MSEGNLTFRGIFEAEMQDRTSEYRTGVPEQGGKQALLVAPARKTSRIKVMNTGQQAVDVRAVHGGSQKSVSGENIVALTSGTKVVGQLAQRSLVPGSVVVTEAGALLDLVDSGADGVLHAVGDPADVRGSVDYANGIVDGDFGAAVAQPIVIDYDHTNFTEFQSAVQSEAGFVVGGAYPETIALQWGRIVPGSVAYTDSGALTFIDDGKGNIVETTGGSEAVVGSIDYGTGIITQTAGSAVLTSPLTVLDYRYNPFGRVLQPGAGQADFSFLSSEFPELTAQPFADGIKGESEIGLAAESLAADEQSSLTAEFSHFQEEQYRVRQLFSGFPPGGESNDSRVGLITN